MAVPDVQPLSEWHVERSNKLHDLRVDMGHMLRFTDLGFVYVYVLPVEDKKDDGIIGSSFTHWPWCFFCSKRSNFLPTKMGAFWRCSPHLMAVDQLAPCLTGRVLVSLDGNSQFVLCTL